MTRLCRCGHTASAHDHHRADSDCSLCDCPRWRRRLSITLPWSRNGG